jgi:hypothetical protein
MQQRSDRALALFLIASIAHELRFCSEIPQTGVRWALDGLERQVEMVNWGVIFGV